MPVFSRLSDSLGTVSAQSPRFHQSVFPDCQITYFICVFSLNSILYQLYTVSRLAHVVHSLVAGIGPAA